MNWYLKYSWIGLNWFELNWYIYWHYSITLHRSSELDLRGQTESVLFGQTSPAWTDCWARAVSLALLARWVPVTAAPDWLPGGGRPGAALLSSVLKSQLVVIGERRWGQTERPSVKHQNGRWSVPTETAAVSTAASANGRPLLLLSARVVFHSVLCVCLHVGPTLPGPRPAPGSQTAAVV